MSLFHRLFYLISCCILFISILSDAKTGSCAEGKKQQDEFVISDSIASFQNAIDNGDLTLAKVEIDKLTQYKKRQGTNNVYMLSGYLTSAAKGLLSKNKIDEAIMALDASISLSPDLYKPYFILSSAYLKKFDIKNGVLNIFIGINLYRKNCKNSYVPHILTIIITSLFLTFIVIFLLLFIIHFRNILADIGRFYEVYGSKYNISSIFSVLVILSFLTIGGTFIFLLVVPVFLWGYLKKNGRTAIVIFFIFLLLIPSLTYSIARRTVYSKSQLYKTLVDMTNNTWDENGFKVLQERQKLDADNWIINFSLGTINKKRGNFLEASRLFARVLEKNTRDPHVFVNIGNSLINTGDIDSAVKYYNRAKEIDDNLFEARFNLGQALGELGKIEEASKEFAQALEIDSKRASYYMNLENAHFNQRILDCPLPYSAIQNTKNLFKNETDVIYTAIWGYVSGSMGSRRFLIFVTISILATAALYRFILAREGYSTLCSACGEVFKNTISENDKKHSKCNDCLTIDIDSYNIDTLKKKEVEGRIKRYKKIQGIASKVVNTLFPGGGYIVYQNIIYGGINLIITSIIITALFFQIFISRSVNDNSIIYNLTFIILAVFYYAITNIIFIKKCR